MMKHFLIIILSLFPFSAFASGNNTDTGSGYTSVSFIVTGKVRGQNMPLEYNIAKGTVKGFIASSENYPVQLGAFRLKFNADAFFREVVEYIDRNAIMIREEGLYKIRITSSPVPGKEKVDDNEDQAGLTAEEPQDSIQVLILYTSSIKQFRHIGCFGRFIRS